MSDLIPKIEMKTTDLMGSLRNDGTNVDVAAVFELFVFKLMAFIIFSEDVEKEAHLDSEASESYEQLCKSQRAIGTYGHVPWLYSVAQKFAFLIPDNDIFTRLATLMIDEFRKVIDFNAA